jgi:hemoglobin
LLLIPKSTNVRTMPPVADLTSPADVVRLVDAFYSRVRQDALLATIFDDVAQVDWAVHLPKMYAFWESVLFGEAGFKGNPLAVHRALAFRTPLAPGQFRRWLDLFGESVDSLFSGPLADAAKVRAARIADVMQFHIALDQSSAGASRGPRLL